jgi:hypothetical protein
MSGRGGLGQVLTDLVGDLAAMALAHARLAAREAGDQSRQAAGILAGLLAGVMVALAGILLAAAAVGLLLGEWLGHPAWGLGAVGVPAAAIGMAVAYRARRRLTAIHPLAETMEELEESRRWLKEEALPTLRDGGQS